MKRLRVGVVYGGRSSEHEVSLASAAAVIAHLDPERYTPISICIGKNGRWSLADRAPSTVSAAEVIERSRSQADAPGSTHRGRDVYFLSQPSESQILTIQRDSEQVDEGVRAVIGTLDLDVVFPIVHGPFGEDGTLQGLLELANVPYVGAGVLGSAVGMDKAVAKTLFEARGLPVVAYAVVLATQWDIDHAASLEDLSRRLTYPMFVKPARLGSSIGISKVRDRAQLEQAIDVARQFDRKIIVEVAVPNARELECAVLGNDTPQASVAGEIVPAGEFYDYESKYVDEHPNQIIPAALTPQQARKTRAMALEAFRAVDCAGMARVDFLMARKTRRIFLNELNTIPGFTTISMYPKLWQASGLEYPQLLDRLIELALERHREKQKLRTSLS